MASVELEKVVKRYGELEVVHSIDLSIRPEEFVVLVGPSGCGKSTTLRMIAGLEAISDGTISIGGRRINDIAPKDRDVAMVFQDYALYPHLTVSKNISFGLSLRRVPKAQIQKAVDEAANILSLQDLLDRKPADLSGGQRQRVAMGRAIVRDPKVFLFDEPLSNLDAKLRTQMRAEIKRLHDRLRTTVVYVTHDQVEAMTLADRIVVMNEGNIEQVGTPMELFLTPANTFVAGFIGSPAMNLMPGKVVSRDGGLAVEIGGQKHVPVPAKDGMDVKEGQTVTLGIRADDLSPEPPADMPSSPLDCKVDLVETLGAEALLHLFVADTPIIAKADGRKLVDYRSETQSVHVNLQHIHIFDSTTGRSVY